MPDNRFSKYAQPQVVNPNPMFPGQMQGQQLNNQGQSLTNAEKSATLPLVVPKAKADLVNTQVNTEQNRQSMQNQKFNQNQGLRQEYAKLPLTANYNTVIQKVGGALNAPDTAQGDLAVLYAFATAMDPNSVVRESEQEMAKSTASRFEQLKKTYNMGAEGARLPKNVRPGLVETMRRNVDVVNDFYNKNRDFYSDLAKRNGFDPYEIVGPHMGEVMRPLEEQYIKDHGGTPKIDGVPTNLSPEQRREFLGILKAKGADAGNEYLARFGKQMQDPTAANRPYSEGVVEVPGGPKEGTYGNSYLGQGISGANEGLASTLGAPADLARFALNLVPQGINAVANTNIPTLPQAIGGGEWWKDRLTDAGSIQAPTEDPSKQFVRRVGQSVGASAVPALGAGGSLGKIAAGFASGVGSGIGGATAQLIAPGNPIAELVGDVVGGGATGYGVLKGAQRAAQRKIESAVPTVADLKNEAKGLYRKAENKGVVAGAEQTQQLADGFRQTFLDEGQLGPSGKITDADTHTSKAFNLIQQYAGREMKPKEMNTIRKVLGDSRKSADPSDQRLGHMLLEQFDDWANPLAPEFADARAVSSRYLQAQDLERARELAGARASQFTGSGFENALRTEYRGLDRANIKGNNYFTPEVTDAIQTVARGTPASNLFRGIGRLAPTGPVSAGMGSVLPALTLGSLTNPTTGAALGVGLGTAGALGRVGATRMGIRAADQAELIARNGGALEQAPILPKSLGDYVAMLMAAQAPKFVNLPERKPGQ